MLTQGILPNVGIVTDITVVVSTNEMASVTYDVKITQLNIVF